MVCTQYVQVPREHVDPKLVIKRRALGKLREVDANLLGKLGEKRGTAKARDGDARGDGPPQKASHQHGAALGQPVLRVLPEGRFDLTTDLTAQSSGIDMGATLVSQLTNNKHVQVGLGGEACRLGSGTHGFPKGRTGAHKACAEHSVTPSTLQCIKRLDGHDSSTIVPCFCRLRGVIAMAISLVSGMCTCTLVLGLSGCVRVLRVIVWTQETLFLTGAADQVAHNDGAIR